MCVAARVEYCHIIWTALKLSLGSIERERVGRIPTEVTFLGHAVKMGSSFSALQQGSGHHACGITLLRSQGQQLAEAVRT